MALITCLECSKEISDTAASCPSCGYVMKHVETSPEPQTEEKKPTQLAEAKKSRANGIMGVVVGSIVIIVGIPLITAIVGIFLIIGGFIFLAFGIKSLKGTRKGTCPFCKTAIAVDNKEPTYKCIHCKNRSRIDGDMLIPI